MKATHTPTQPERTDVELTPAQILRGAAIYLQVHGWYQGGDFATDPTPEQPFPPACAMAGIAAAVTGTCATWSVLDREYFVPFQHAMRVLAGWLRATTLDLDNDGLIFDRPDLTDPYMVVTDWNDEAGRTLGEVTAAMNDAAEHWEQLHSTGGAR